MPKKLAAVSGTITITFHVDGYTPADVLAAEQAILAAVRRRRRTRDAKATTTLSAPGLIGLPLGELNVYSKRRDLLARASVVDPATFFACTADSIQKILSWGALKEIRQGLFKAGQGEHLAGDDPDRFPHLIDSLSISLEIYAWLRERGIETIAQLVARHDEPAIARKVGHLNDLLQPHASSYGITDYVT